MLFSEPKIPQWPLLQSEVHTRRSFSALQRAENSSIQGHPRVPRSTQRFQCSSASRKFLNVIVAVVAVSTSDVSVLFSEPKIPQYKSPPRRLRSCPSFSALQRAENSSIVTRTLRGGLENKFQCSSASRKFLNTHAHSESGRVRNVSVLFSEPKIPQSAESAAKPTADRRFSALQRAENSSILTHDKVRYRGYFVSVLFSEPKIPQLSMRSSTLICSMVSVLFSEPKIPQSPSHGNPASTNGFVSVLFNEPKLLK